MNKSLIVSIFLLLSFGLNSQSFKRCDYEKRHSQLSASPEFRAAADNFEQQVRGGRLQKSETVFLIPLVVHVVYKNFAENISTAQILSQIDVMNEDFRKRNADTTNVEPEFSIADSRIEFCLARRDPNGNVTTGINRVSTTLDNIGVTEQYHVIQPAWNPDHYLNIWVGDYGPDGGGNEILGGASPPGEPNRNRDGIMISFRAFGTSGTATAPYNHGRTTVHELGHWFNLYHPWGINSASCGDDDQVADTPNQDQVYFDCPPNPSMSCLSKDMLSNFMGYVDDQCMGNFSEGQKDRMRNSLVLQRPSLLLSKGCLAVGLDENQAILNSIQLFPNPANNEFTLAVNQNDAIKGAILKMYDLNGRIVFHKALEDNQKQYQIATDHLKAGIYLVQIIYAEAANTFKLSVQH